MNNSSDSVIRKQSDDVLDIMQLSQQHYRSQQNASSSESIGILVMGLTGAGKSTFISQLTNQDAEIGHSLESCTTDIIPYEFRRSDGRKLYLIDTPGFDDTSTDYAGVFKKIASFLCTLSDLFGSRLTIGGMIYAHRITDVRMSGSSVKSLRIFEKICGEHCFKHVTVITTMWNLIKTQEAIDAATIRENTLKERAEFFGTLIRADARMERHYDEDSARHIVEMLADRQRHFYLQLQQEMKQSRTMTLDKTTAGKYMEGELDNMRRRYEMQKKELEESAEESNYDDDFRSEVLEEIRDCTVTVNRLKADQGSLSVTLEDMQHEQAVWFTRKHDDILRDRISDEQSIRVTYELQQKVLKLEKENRRRDEKEIAQNEKMEELEERNKRLEAAQKELEDQQALRERVKEKRNHQFDWVGRMRAFLASPAKDLREPVPITRRADSMPLEAKTSKRSATKLTRGRSQSRNGQNGKANAKNMTHVEEQDTKSYYMSLSSQNQHNKGYDQVHQLGYDVVGIVNSNRPKHSQHRSLPTYTPITPGYATGQVQSLPGQVIIDPYGLKRTIPPSTGSLPRRYDDTTHTSVWQSPLQSGSYHDNQPNDIIIAVMGITGCGKTTFVNLFAETPLEVGHGLDSCTVSVQVATCKAEDGTRFYLVDTPGFDDTYRSDSEILREVALWLNKAHVSNVKLAGIIFLQRISDFRVGGSGIKNIKMFQKLCGEDTLASVVLATTMWEQAGENAGKEREKQLKRELQLWKKMIDHGSKVYRHDSGKVSATKIINYLIARKRPVTLDIQREMVDQAKDLVDTGAGSELASTVELLIKNYERKLKDLEKELRLAREQHNKEDREIIEQAKKEYQEGLTKQRQEMVNLRISSEQLIEDARKRFEEQEERQRENMKLLREAHTKDLEQQRILVQKQFRERYLRDMSNAACVMM
ncbi:P-loop containing nucleoside triphosphate hydrolase protein [Bipolaris maydis]|nr:P-loop containing nucleoside triphosphate hydrolase protein [Bipolaris maydis]